ncbi:MAG: DUF6817 domain-containing protein [Xenococcus sp. (in: cyanobacteria)]
MKPILSKIKSYLNKCKTIVNQLIDSYKWHLRDRNLDPSQELMEFLIDLNADSILHSSTTLLRHLVGTYQLLKKWEVTDYVSLAGLYHSIYGTQTFKKFLINPQERDKLREIIDSKSEKLVYYFYIQNKKDFFSNLNQTNSFAIKNRLNNSTISLTKEEFTDLLRIRLADYIEQMERMNFSAKFLKKQLQKSESFLDPKEYYAILNNLPVYYLDKIKQH